MRYQSERYLKLTFEVIPLHHKGILFFKYMTHLDLSHNNKTFPTLNTEKLCNFFKILNSVQIDNSQFQRNPNPGLIYYDYMERPFRQTASKEDLSPHHDEKRENPCRKQLHPYRKCGVQSLVMLRVGYQHIPATKYLRIYFICEQ